MPVVIESAEVIPDAADDPVIEPIRKFLNEIYNTQLVNVSTNRIQRNEFITVRIITQTNILHENNPVTS